MDSSLEYYEVSFSVSFYGFCFEVIFVWYKYCYSSFFFSCLFAWNIFFSHSSVSVCVFFSEMVSCRLHMCRSCFLIHSATLYLLIRAFNPFTFKLIIDRYLFIFPPLYLCSSLTHSFYSCSYTCPFNISCSAGLVEVCSFSLLLSGKLLISPSILIESLTR